MFLFLLISVFLSLVGFKFWAQPKAALERVRLASPRKRCGIPA